MWELVGNIIGSLPFDITIWSNFPSLPAQAATFLVRYCDSLKISYFGICVKDWIWMEELPVIRSLILQSR
jgi:hypothetical protein